ncbi:uncharacterized protein LOC129260535 [Lytechinus pictus]|uniref:uncharacterized protein LOC129260535 n=1 Tax=Lytechinus pictus TaxID=7653 RepID=UPI00240D56F9|nr:uncharacterized protein LOC129260535 [Lytechinus pictus]
MGILGVIISTIACQVIGFIWYGPNPIGRMWLNSCGRKKEELQKTGNLPYLVATFSKAITAYFLDGFLRAGMGVVTVEEAFYASINLSIIVALLEATHAPFHGVGLPAYLVNIGYDAACLMVIAVLVIAF